MKGVTCMLRVNRTGKSKLQWSKVKDSGNRTAFTTGSQRDTQQGKGRYDLIPSSVLLRLAQHYENGALKYGDNNWQKGQPLAQYYNSAIRHLEAIRNADIEEDHFAAVIWNVACMIHHIDSMLDYKLPKELDSFGIVDAIISHEAFNTLTEYQDPIQDTKKWTPTNSTWTPVVMSGALSDVPLPHAFDKDRFVKRRVPRLDPEELG